MDRKKESSIKDLNYSSPDCQLLIREYTKLIYKMAKEYDALVSENKELRNKLEQMSSFCTAQADVYKSKVVLNDVSLKKRNKKTKLALTYLMEKFFTTIHLYGWKFAVQRVKTKLINIRDK